MKLSHWGQGWTTYYPEVDRKIETPENKNEDIPVWHQTLPGVYPISTVKIPDTTDCHVRTAVHGKKNQVNVRRLCIKQ